MSVAVVAIVRPSGLSASGSAAAPAIVAIAALLIVLAVSERPSSHNRSDLHGRGSIVTDAPRFPRLRLGTAPDSWGVWFADDPLQVAWPRYLDEAASAGYRWTE